MTMKTIHTIWADWKDGGVDLLAAVDATDVDENPLALENTHDYVERTLVGPVDAKRLDIQVPDDAITAKINDINDLPDHTGIVLIVIENDAGWTCFNAQDISSINQNAREFLNMIDGANEQVIDGETVWMIALEADFNAIKDILRTPTITLNAA